MTLGLWSKWGLVEHICKDVKARECGSFRKLQIIHEWLDCMIRRCKNLKLIAKSYRERDFGLLEGIIFNSL